MLGIFALHAVEIWSYAVLYLTLGEIENFESALYFSTVAFTTVGFGVGAGLTLDEFALWVHLEDVSWSEQGRVSLDAVQPISGSISLGPAGSNSITHRRVLRLPDCMAVLAGR